MDETAARHDHNYVTLFVSLDEHQTLYVSGGKDSGTIGRFCTDFQEHKGNLNQIEQVSCDMSHAFIKGIEESLRGCDSIRSLSCYQGHQQYRD
jgi:transposase